MICSAAVVFLVLTTAEAAPQKYNYRKEDYRKDDYYGSGNYQKDYEKNYGAHKYERSYGKYDKGRDYKSYGDSDLYADYSMNYHDYKGDYKAPPREYKPSPYYENYAVDGHEADETCPATPTCNRESHYYRTKDGSCNNLEYPSWGKSGLPYRRVMPKQDSLVDCGRASHLPNPRLASGTLVRRGEDEYNYGASVMVMIYGQVIDHDLMKTPECGTFSGCGKVDDCCEAESKNAANCCPIIAPRSDHFYGKAGRPTCISFLKSIRVKDAYCKKWDVMNENTAFLDASFLYGSDRHQANVVRDFEGGHGALRFQHDAFHRMYPPVSINGSDIRVSSFSGLYDLGDSRGDVHSGFLLIHIAFLRLHNDVAATLSEMHPDWSDEWLFQETKKIVIAIHQQITYAEWLDVLLGKDNHIHVHSYHEGYENVYDPDVDPTISMVFSTSAYRLHTLIPGYYVLRNKHYKETGKMWLRDNFRNPKELNESTRYDDLIRGLATQPIHDFDNVFTTEMTEWLFAENDTETGVRSGLDIVAFNVQRGRDHQLPTYPSYKAYCGYEMPKTWEDMTDLISPDHVHRLYHLYKRPADVDLYIAQNMERPVDGTLLGPTSHCLIRDQFERLKSGDRFFYTNSYVFTPYQLSAIKKMTLSRVLCDYADNPEEMRLPRDMFRVMTDRKGGNPLLSCKDYVNIPPLDLEPWR